MNKKTVLFCSTVIVTIMFSRALAENRGPDNLYRNDEYRFRIKFPVGWVIKQGEAKHTIKKAVDPKTASSITISAAKVPRNIDLNAFSQKELDDFLIDSIEDLKSQYSGLKVIEQGIRHLDNKKAVYIKYSFSYKILDITINMITLQYATTYKGTYYSIGGGAPEAVFYSQEGIINRAIASFFFEDDDDVESLLRRELITYRDDAHRFVFQYPKTWSKVPPTYQNTKIKIANEYGSGDAHCMIDVQYNPSLKDVTPKEYTISVSPEILQEAMKNVLPNATIIQSGKTFLSNQEAFFAITKFTSRNLDVEVPMKLFSIQSVRDGYFYTFSCGASSDRFDEMFPIFQLISAGFSLRP